MSDATVELAMQQRQQLPFTLRPGADDALQASCATPEGAGTGTHEDSPGPPTVGGVRGVRGHIHTQANEGMFRSASKPLPSRRSSALVPGIQERRSKVGGGDERLCDSNEVHTHMYSKQPGGDIADRFGIAKAQPGGTRTTSTQGWKAQGATNSCSV